MAERRSFEDGVRQAIEWLRADYEYGTGPDWREQGCEWIAERLTDWRRDRRREIYGDAKGEKP